MVYVKEMQRIVELIFKSCTVEEYKNVGKVTVMYDKKMSGCKELLSQLWEFLN